MAKSWPAWFGLLLGLAALMAALQLDAAESEEWRHAASWTARTGLFLFLAAYCARPLAQLAPNRFTKALLRQRRYWGLGFAASHTVHLAALSTYLTVSSETPPIAILIGGGLGYVLLYAMALTSNTASMKAFGARWKLLHRTGIHYLWFIFAFSYFGRVNDPDRAATGLVLFALVVLAGLLRFAAWRRKRA